MGKQSIHKLSLSLSLLFHDALTLLGIKKNPYENMMVDGQNKKCEVQGVSAPLGADLGTLAAHF